MKLQAVRFLVERDAFPEYGFACVKEFGLSDVYTYEKQLKQATKLRDNQVAKALAKGAAGKGGK